jgi:hypothetical protein
MEGRAFDLGSILNIMEFEVQGTLKDNGNRLPPSGEYSSSRDWKIWTNVTINNVDLLLASSHLHGK